MLLHNRTIQTDACFTLSNYPCLYRVTAACSSCSMLWVKSRETPWTIHYRINTHIAVNAKSQVHESTNSKQVFSPHKVTKWNAQKYVSMHTSVNVQCMYTSCMLVHIYLQKWKGYSQQETAPCIKGTKDLIPKVYCRFWFIVHCQIFSFWFLHMLPLSKCMYMNRPRVSNSATWKKFILMDFVTSIIIFTVTVIVTVS